MQAAIKVLTDAIELAERRKKAAQDEIDEHEYFITVRRKDIAYYEAEIATLNAATTSLNTKEVQQ